MGPCDAFLGPAARGIGSRLDCDVTDLGAAAIVRVAGHLTASNIGTLAAVFAGLRCSRLAVIVVDLHDLEGIGPAGVAAFVRLGRHVRGEGTRLRIITDNLAVLTALVCSRCKELEIWDTSGRLMM